LNENGSRSTNIAKVSKLAKLEVELLIFADGRLRLNDQKFHVLDRKTGSLPLAAVLIQPRRK
jgi:hypothetical protein